MSSESERRTIRRVNFGSDFVNQIGSMANSFAQASAIQGSADYQMTLATINNRFAEVQSRDILKTANKNAIEHGKNIKRLVGAQRASFAGSNILVGDGTAADIQDQTIEIGMEEQTRIRNNAWKQAFGIRAQASAQLLAARNAKEAADFQARTTLVSGAIAGIGGIAGAFSGAGNFSKGSQPAPNDQVAVLYDPAKYKG